MTSPTGYQTSIERDGIATISLTLYSLAVAVGFARVFSGWDFFWDLALIAVVGHGASFVLRRARVSGWLAIPFVSMILLWLLAALHYGDTMTWLLPRGTTWDQVDLEVGLVRDQFETAIAPVLYGAGWATLAGFALVIAVVMADSFAFRAEARGEALVPGGVLFVFIAALGSPRLRITATVLLIAAGVVTVIALRALHDRTRRVELTAARGPASMTVPAALGSALVVAVLAGVIGPRIPGAQAEPLYETRGRGGGVTQVVSPLVDIRSRLVNRGESELFRVNADAPAYWRATTLPWFDGRTFRLPTRALERIEGEFGTGPLPDEGRIRQQIQAVALGGLLVPAAAEPYQADGFSGGQQIDLRVNRDTNTLVTPDEIQPGDVFNVVSAAPTLSPAELRATGSSSPPDPIFVELPDDLPAIVSDLARQVTAGSPTAYDAAIALQDWFREEFDYSLDVQSGHGSNAIESFLNERVGYCEQFSATFAAMARTLGIPSRVAVGFTPGLLNEDGWYVVLGKNAHAWPELWFDGIGWVPFEPTPGRGEPGAESYTGVPAEQDETGPQGTGGVDGQTGAEPAPTTPSTVVPPRNTVDDGQTVPTLDPRSLGDRFGDGGTGTQAPTTQDGSGVPWRPITLTIFVLGLLMTPWTVRRIRLRATRAQSPTDRIVRAWERARAAAVRGGVIGRPSMTAREWAAATAAQLPVAGRPMSSLADVVDRVGYAPPGSFDPERAGSFGSTVGQECELWSAQIDRIADDTLTPLQRIRNYFTNWR